MCGIVGYIGDRDVLSVLVKGLKKLEYRGYDSAGVAFIRGGKMQVVKAKGRLKSWRKNWQARRPNTRWASGIPAGQPTASLRT